MCEKSGRPHAPFHCGFTLVELLVVIFIISLLAGLVVPSFQRAKQLARSVMCMANLRNIQQAMALYASFNSDLLPPKFEMKKSVLTAKDLSEGKKINTPEEGIQTVLRSYASATLFRCPGDIGSYGDSRPVWQRRGASYEVKGVNPKDINDPSKADKADFWLKMAEGKDLATDLFKPWEAKDIKKIREKIGKGELGPAAWHGEKFNMVLAKGYALSVQTQEEEKAAKGD
ncbi:MAG: type II secretion system protein [Planctomycetes bacterium]|nr:type II secretion system protein [Planctomycetota bacterium]